MLIRQLPASSRYRARLAGDRYGRRWDEQEHLLAQLVDRVALLTRVVWVGSVKGEPPDQMFRPVHRPGDPDPRALNTAAARKHTRRLELVRDRGLLGDDTAQIRED